MQTIFQQSVILYSYAKLLPSLLTRIQSVHFQTILRVKKGTLLLPITLPNVDRFLKFFHLRTTSKFAITTHKPILIQDRYLHFFYQMIFMFV